MENYLNYVVKNGSSTGVYISVNCIVYRGVTPLNELNF